MSKIRQFYFNVITRKKKGSVAAVLRGILCVLSMLYYCGNCVNKYIGLVRRKKLSCPVISVGNITWGGTGKTPLVDLILDLCKTHNKKCAVLLRGYGNDEDALLRKNHPTVHVLSGADRYYNAVQFLENESTDLFILDDGFQHWRLARDCDVVTINSIDPWIGNALIPRGALREPFSALKRADMVVLTNCNLVDPAKKAEIRRIIEYYAAPADIFEACYVPQGFFRVRDPEMHIPLVDLQGKSAVLFAGIGTPEAFRKTIEKFGIVVSDFIQYPDHHAYTRDDFANINKMISVKNPDVIITTEKDYMRDSKLMTTHIDSYVLKIKMELIDNYDAFVNRLARSFIN